MKIIFVLLLVITFSKELYSQWSEVSQGTNGSVNSFYVDSVSDLLFVGGQFDQAGTMNLNNIATWDGINWSSFGSNEILYSSGTSDVSAIVNYNGSIIIGGRFDSIGNVGANNIARWNGSTWESLGNGFDDKVEDLIVYNGDLYACGFFSFSGSDFVECFAKWNGLNWERVSHLIGYAYSLEIYNNKLIIAGTFNHQSISSIVSIMGWDGNNIDTTLGYFSNSVFEVRNINDTLYVVGSFTSNVSNPSNYISLFFNNSWHSIGNPTGGLNWITDVVKYNSKIYLSGYFANPPDLCSYNGLGFDSVADVLGFIKTLMNYKGILYAGGAFSQLNGIAINNIAKFYDIGNYINKDMLTEEDASIFPNPNYDGIFYIKINNVNLKEQIKINIHSNNGRMNNSFYLDKMNEDNYKLKMPITPGVYYFSFEKNNLILFIKKVIIS